MKSCILYHEDIDNLEINDKYFQEIGYNVVTAKNIDELLSILHPNYDFICVSKTAWETLSHEVVEVLTANNPEVHLLPRVADEFLGLDRAEICDELISGLEFDQLH